MTDEKHGEGASNEEAKIIAETLAAIDVVRHRKAYEEHLDRQHEEQVKEYENAERYRLRCDKDRADARQAEERRHKDWLDEVANVQTFRVRAASTLERIACALEALVPR